MSFEETKDGFYWQCDRCGLVAEFAPVSFWRALDELKARGWVISRSEGGREDDWGTWTHWCAKCGRKSAAEILNMPVVAKRANAS